MEQVLAAAPVAPPSLWRVIGAATIGNVLEWYDWAAYGFLVTYIATNFFPSGDPTASSLLTFATFGIGFVTRLVGAVVVGWIGEVHGRKAALMTTFFVMGIGTLLIAFIPGHAAIGIWAPILARHLPHAPGLLDRWRARRLARLHDRVGAGESPGALCQLPAGLDQLRLCCSALGVAAPLNTLLTPEDMAAWGWRLPFLLGGILLPVGIWLRSWIEETPAFLPRGGAMRRRLPREARRRWCSSPSPSWPRPSAASIWSSPIRATHVVKFGGLSPAEALWSNTIGLTFVMVFTPLMGALSDRIGRRPMLLAVTGFFLVGSYFIFSFVASSPGFVAIMLMQIGLGIVVAIFHGVCPVAVTELFPTRGRSLLLSVAFAIGIALAGGFAPFIATWLIAVTGSSTAPAFYMIATTVVTAIAVLMASRNGARQLASSIFRKKLNDFCDEEICPG